ncbi:MAG: hypothetical protein CL722_06245 [Chloroflexi bacterium]|nr:hypothetical protein [Chloroflexota bacterium]
MRNKNMLKSLIKAKTILTLAMVATLAMVLQACGGTEIVEVEKIITKEVPVEVEKIVKEEVIVEVEKIVTKEVPVEVEKIVKETITKVVEKVVVATASAAPVDTSNLPAPKGKSGVMTFAMIDVGKGAGINSAGSMNYKWGITETPFMTNMPGDVVGMVVDTWEKTGDKLLLKVKKGIQFHDGWGEFDAYDLAWNLDDTNTNTNEDSISYNAGDYGALFTSHKAIDAETVEITVNTWDVRWAANQLNNQGQTMEIYSKKVFDDKGGDAAAEQWMIENIIATGPFQVVEYKDEEKIVVDAVKNHHRHSPLIDQMIYLEVPEAAARKAMLLTGEVDGADLILPDRKELQAEGFSWASANSGKEQVVIFGGNYWEDTRLDTGEALTPWELDGFKEDLPWVGCPWEDKCPYTDTNNPAGIDDMEQARLVRWAMAMAYDRDLINETIFAGQAMPDHISMFIPSLPEFKDEWKVPYDPAKAEEYLDQAGYPRDGDGIRFEHKFITMAGFGEEILQGIAGFWEEIGIKTESQILDYRGVFRPTVVDRSNTLVYIQGCRHHNGLPFDWPRGPQNTALTRGGFGCGIEMPWIAEAFLAANEQEDAAARIEINTGVAEKMHHWMPQSGIAVVPNGMIVNPLSIKEWPMRDGFESSPIQGPELLVPAR